MYYSSLCFSHFLVQYAPQLFILLTMTIPTAFLNLFRKWEVWQLLNFWDQISVSYFVRWSCHSIKFFRFPILAMLNDHLGNFEKYHHPLLDQTSSFTLRQFGLLFFSFMVLLFLQSLNLMDFFFEFASSLGSVNNLDR